MKKEIEELRKKYAEAKHKYKKKSKTKGATDEDMEFMFMMMDDMFSSIHGRMSIVEDELYSFINQHTANHLPHLSASALEKLLDVAGVGDDFEIVRPSIFVSNAKKKEFTVVFPDKAKK